MVTDFAFGVKVWWALISAVGLLNIGLWVAISRRLRTGTMADPELARYRYWQWLMSGLYVFGCASRCFIPRSDVARFSLVDSWFATVLVGRSIATVAEIAFVVQWALLLHFLARRKRVRAGTWLAWFLVPLIVIAEICSWYGVITTNYLGHVIEESIWAGTALLMILGLGLCLKRAETQLRRFIQLGLVMGSSYVLYMVTIDVPNYFKLWRANEAAGKTYLSLSEGFQDVQRVVVTGRWEDWQYPVLWMSLYFSVAVWISLAMIHWPRQVERESSSPSG